MIRYKSINKKLILIIISNSKFLTRIFAEAKNCLQLHKKGEGQRKKKIKLNYRLLHYAPNFEDWPFQ